MTLNGWQVSPAEETKLQSVVSTFNRTHPNIKIDYQSITGDYQAQMLAKFAARKPPDVFYVDVADIRDWVGQGVIQPLNSYVKATKFSTKPFYKNLLNAFKVGKTYYGFPKDWSSLGMTVYDNLAFGLRNQKVPRSDIDRRVRRAAEILDLDPLLKRKPKQLSGGQRQRVAMGRAIVREPQVFLMDEPLSNLDAKLRVQTRAEILKLQHELGTTTIYVTHDQIEAMTMGDRVAVMSMGVLLQVDRPQALYDEPSRVVSIRFIAGLPMNPPTKRLTGWS